MCLGLLAGCKDWLGVQVFFLSMREKRRRIIRKKKKKRRRVKRNWSVIFFFRVCVPGLGRDIIPAGPPVSALHRAFRTGSGVRRIGPEPEVAPVTGAPAAVSRRIPPPCSSPPPHPPLSFSVPLHFSQMMLYWNEWAHWWTFLSSLPTCLSYRLSECLLSTHALSPSPHFIFISSLSLLSSSRSHPQPPTHRMTDHCIETSGQLLETLQATVCGLI